MLFIKNCQRDKIIFFWLLILLSLMLVSCGGKQKVESPTSSEKLEKQTEKITLKFADQFPPSHLISKECNQYFIKRVEELTNGKVTFKYYPSEQLGKVKDFIDLVKGGTADIAYMPVVYVSGKVPLTGVFELPGLFNDLVAGNKACNRLTQEKFYELEFRKLGIMPLMGHLQLIYDAHTVKKPIKSLDDLKGLKLRVPGGAMEETVLRVGARPVSMPSPEIYEALQRGIIDGLFFPHYNCEPYKLNEVLKYATVGANFGNGFSIVFVSDEMWHKFPDDVKKAMTQAANEANMHISEVLKAAEANSVKKAEKEGKIIYYLKPEEQKEWAKFLVPVQEKWVTEMEKRGLPAHQLLEGFKKALKEEGA